MKRIDERRFQVIARFGPVQFQTQRNNTQSVKWVEENPLEPNKRKKVTTHKI